MKFEIPTGKALISRLKQVHEVIYLIFIEGFHSGKKEWLIREDLCGEAIRLSRLLLSSPNIQHSDSYALFALLCFHSARLRSKVNEENEIISLKEQDRSAWYKPLIELGNAAMQRAVENDIYSRYHLEAAIAYEHLRAPTYEATDWPLLRMWYERLHAVHPSPLNLLNMAIIHLQVNEFEDAKKLLDSVSPGSLEQRAYLYYGVMAEYYHAIHEDKEAVSHLEAAIQQATNDAEKSYLGKKLAKFRAST